LEQDAQPVEFDAANVRRAPAIHPNVMFAIVLPCPMRWCRRICGKTVDPGSAYLGSSPWPIGTEGSADSQFAL